MRGIGHLFLAGFLGLVGPAHAADKALDEAEALGAALASNTGEAMVAATMAARAQDPEVRAYAMRLLDDHGNAATQLLNYQEKAGIQAKDSRNLRKDLAVSTKMTEMLWSKVPGVELDQRYLTDTIAHHREELRTLEEVLIPAAQSPQLQTMLTRQREAVMGHLDQACTLGQRLGAETEPCLVTQPGTR